MRLYDDTLAFNKVKLTINNWDYRGVLTSTGAIYDVFNYKIHIDNQKIRIYNDKKEITPLFQEKVDFYNKYPEDRIALNIVFKEVLKYHWKNR